MKNQVLVILSAIVLFSCTPSIRFNGKYNMNNQSGNSSSVQSNVSVGTIFRGKASFYDDKYDGRQTASGEIFSQDKNTAAHRTWQFGTKCKVTNLKNGKSVIVIVNDRGPFIKDRVIDLSKSAAEAIDMIKDGVADVEIEIIN